MGNSSRKNSKGSSTEAAQSKVSPNWPRRARFDDDDEAEEREIENVNDYEEEGDGDEEKEMSHWRQKVLATSPLLQSRPQPRDRRQCSYPSASSSTDEEDRKSRERSESITTLKLPLPSPKSQANIPSKRAPPKPRRGSEQLPNQKQSQQNGSPQGQTEGGQLQLTMVQINLVRKVWQHVRVQGENGPGISIFRQHLIFRCPPVRQLFATDLDGVQTEMCYHKRLITHAERLSELLDELVTNLERPQLVNEKLREWGRLHANVRHIGFTSAFWERFAESINECTLTWCQKTQRCFDAQVAWTTIALYITEQLKLGYYEECRRQRKEAYKGTCGAWMGREGSSAQLYDQGASSSPLPDFNDFDPDTDSP